MGFSSRPTRQMADHRGHLFERSVEDGHPVLRCRYGECGHIWWPDENGPSKPCRAGLGQPASEAAEIIKATGA